MKRQRHSVQSPVQQRNTIGFTLKTGIKTGKNLNCTIIKVVQECESPDGARLTITCDGNGNCQLGTD